MYLRICINRGNKETFPNDLVAVVLQLNGKKQYGRMLVASNQMVRIDARFFIIIYYSY